ncbi:methyltransferase domain-containing protein [Pyruvatibacter sp.]|uniref:class I SAM-dependent methyltransferase n=1 Tax=Pyruvatibacter sp. TaxID=1981328 RepID=UPI0032ED1909
MIKAEDFWDKAAPKYALQPIQNERAYQETLEETRRHLTLNDAVLEVGCGTGSTALQLAGSAGHITATDISGSMIAIGQEKAERLGVANITFLPATLTDERIPPGPYDVVLAFNFLHLLDDVPGAAKSIHTLLKPGGLFISKSACLGRYNVFFRILIAAAQLFRKAPYVAFFSKKELEDMISSQGFEIIDARYFAGAKRSWYVVARKK